MPAANPAEPAPVAVVIAAAGSGSRMSERAGGPSKQWRLLGGKPLVEYAFRFFDALPVIGQIALAVDLDGWIRALLTGLIRAPLAGCLRSDAGKPVRLVLGGASRQESVWRALQALEPPPEIVLIHDAARPFPPLDAVGCCIAEAREVGGAILARSVVETVKRTGPDLEVLETLDRANLWAAQTPQGFRYPELVAAYRAAEQRLAGFTDDAAIFEANGGRVRIVPSPDTNLKITLPEDFERAERILAARQE